MGEEAGPGLQPPCILATTDGGRTWKAQKPAGLDSSSELFDVACADVAHAWVVGYYNKILATTDGGATWKAQDPGLASGSLMTIAFADASHGCAVGEDAFTDCTIVTTSNGGATWTQRRSTGLGAEDAQLWGVAFGDAAHAVAVGSDGPTVVRTSDGGATWLVTATNGTTRHLSGVAFADATHGWAVGAEHKGENTILATADGGITWARQHSGLAASLTAVACTDASRAWAVGFFGTIVATADGGVTWTAQASGVGDHHLYDVAFADASHGWAVGGQGTIVVTSDGGTTWTKQNPAVVADLHGVACVDASHAWAVGTEETGPFTRAGVILVTSNGGATWTRQDAGVAWELLDVAFADARHGWAVGTARTRRAIRPRHDPHHHGRRRHMDGAKIHRHPCRGVRRHRSRLGLGPTVGSDDGGATWTGQTADGGVPFSGRCIFFLDRTHGWVVGDNGGIYATTTGGWTPPSVKVSGAVNNGWYNHTLDVTLTGVPAVSGIGIASVTWALDGGQRHTVAGASAT